MTIAMAKNIAYQNNFIMQVHLWHVKGEEGGGGGGINGKVEMSRVKSKVFLECISKKIICYKSLDVQNITYI